MKEEIQCIAPHTISLRFILLNLRTKAENNLGLWAQFLVLMFLFKVSTQQLSVILMSSNLLSGSLLVFLAIHY